MRVDRRRGSWAVKVRGEDARSDRGAINDYPRREGDGVLSLTCCRRLFGIYYCANGTNQRAVGVITTT